MDEAVGRIEDGESLTHLQRSIFGWSERERKPKTPFPSAKGVLSFKRMARKGATSPIHWGCRFPFPTGLAEGLAGGEPFQTIYFPLSCGTVTAVFHGALLPAVSAH